MADDHSTNYALFRDCLSTALLRPDPEPKTAGPRRRRRAKSKSTSKSTPISDAPLTSGSQSPSDDQDLSDFIDYLASDIFDSLPDELQEVDHRSWRESAFLQRHFTLPLTTSSLTVLNLPPHISETLITYGVVSPELSTTSHLPTSTEAFLSPVLTSYLSTQIEPPPASSSSRTSECEICARSWIPLSYHHLIPRFVHDKAIKRGWHKKEDLQNVAWLCGACHRFVHNFKNHEDLARYYYTVDLLLEEDEVQKWANWASKLRWKGGRSAKRA